MRDIELKKLSKWILAIPIDDYFEVARARPPGLGKNPLFRDLQLDMREQVPVPGNDWVHDIDVLIGPHQHDHQGQRWHKHDEWTAIFYVTVGNPPVPIRIRDEVEEWSIEPQPGDCLILPPDTEHRVANSRSPDARLSFAMLVQAPGRKSKYA